MQSRNLEQINCEKIKEILELHKDYKPIIQNILNNFTYFLDNFVEIKELLKSSEFYNRYKKDNHPYPSLINPKIADYKNIPAELAWEMNLPLPTNYKFIWLYSHGTAATEVGEYLVKKLKI
ncbi:hypothetical protein [Helicobacter burdigaliensis]|uniref:hypothetical protein n=1 Tax=Helicobacter burdigaliensis TaxID=2315334 RepID=UPI000EF71E6E|nr:hypothetical protein [Helicobacter burdigaliensis]